MLGIVIVIHHFLLVILVYDTFPSYGLFMSTTMFLSTQLPGMDGGRHALHQSLRSSFARRFWIKPAIAESGHHDPAGFSEAAPNAEKG